MDADPAHRLLDELRFQFLVMREVRHERQVLARRHHLLEQPQRVVRVGVRHEPLRPVGQRLRPDPDRLHVVHLEQRFDVPPQHRLAHDHRVAAGEQHTAHLGVFPYIARQLLDVVVGHLQVRDAHELRPAEAVGAVRVAGLTLLREEEHRLAVLVLEARDRLLAGLGNVQLQLPGRVRIELEPDLVGRGRDLLLGGLVLEQAGDVVDVLGRQHVLLREDQPEHRILERAVPVDQLVHNVGVRPERQDRRHGPRPEPLLLGQRRSLEQLVQVADGVGLEAPTGVFRSSHENPLL